MEIKTQCFRSFQTRLPRHLEIFFTILIPAILIVISPFVFFAWRPGSLVIIILILTIILVSRFRASFRWWYYSIISFLLIILTISLIFRLRIEYANQYSVRAIPILYGMPGNWDKIESGEMDLGGCVVMPFAPAYTLILKLPVKEPVQ